MPRLVVRDKTLPPRLRKVALLPRARFGLSAVKGARVDAAASADGADGKSRPFLSAVHDARKPDLGVGVTGGGGSGGGGEHVPEPLRIYEQDTIESMPHAEVIYYYRLICQVGEMVGASSSAAQQLKPQLTLASLYSICVAWLLVGGSTMIWLLRQTSRRCHDACRAVQKRRAARVVVLIVLMMPGISATALVPTPVPIPVAGLAVASGSSERRRLSAGSPWAEYRASSISANDGDSVTSWPDTSGNGNDLTVAEGTVTFYADGINGLPALAFSGSQMTTTAALSTPGTELTVFALLKMTDTYGSWGQVVGQGHDDYWVVRRYSTSNSLTMHVQNSNTPYASFSIDQDILAVGTVAATSTTGTNRKMTLYSMNGSILDSSSTSDGNVIDAAASDILCVGWSEDRNTNEQFIGNIRDIVIYDSVLDSDAIANVKADLLGLAPTGGPTITPNPTLTFYPTLEPTAYPILWSDHDITDITSTTGSVNSAMSADVDGDGDADVLSSAGGWYENLGREPGSGGSWSYHTIAMSPNAVDSVYAVDIDGDGDVDAVSADFGTAMVMWYENLDGSGGSWSTHTISTAATAAWSVFAIDIDGDGDSDVVLASYQIAPSTSTTTISWYENLDGSGGSWSFHQIYNAASGARSVHGIDVDGDGDIDVLSAAYFDGNIAWYDNLDGSGASWSFHQIYNIGGGAYSVIGTDLDGDGDVDVLSASETSGVIALHENLDGSGGSWSYLVIDSTANGAHSVFSVDVDDDGDLDVLAALAYENTIAWYENIDSSGGSWAKHEISTTSSNPNSVIGVDIDGDSDIDVLSVASSTIAWYVSACALIASLFVLSVLMCSMRVVPQARAQDPRTNGWPDAEADVDVSSDAGADEL